MKTAGTSIYNGLNMAGVGIYNGAEYSGAFLWDTAYALAGQPGPYCGIWGAAGLANGIDFIAPLFGGGEGGYGASNAVNDESEGLSAEGAIPLEAEASALLRPGELVDQVIQTPGGPVQVRAMWLLKAPPYLFPICSYIPKMHPAQFRLVRDL